MHIELSEITVNSRHGPIVSGITLSISSPSRVVISGPASCGKSTLISVLRGSSAPSSGSVTVDGLPLTFTSGKQIRAHQRRVGVIAQIPVFDRDLTVFENILLAGAARGLTREQATSAALEALADVGMSHRRQHRVDELSDAERTLVGMARAFIGPVEILLIDDAFVGLDEPTLRSALDSVIATTGRREIALVITTSDATLADVVPDSQRYTMHDGRLSPLQEAA